MRTARVDDVADGLIQLVVEGTFPPGSTLPSEAELAERFSVSRLTVREAIRSLSATRVIQVRQGRPSEVSSPEHWSALDARLLWARSRALGDLVTLPRRLLEARRLVEVSIAEVAAQRRNDDDLEAMAHHLDQMRSADSGGDVARFAEADLAFHQAIFDAAENIFISAIFEPLSDVIRSLRHETSATRRNRGNAIQWHESILDAIKVQDTAASREAMEGHLRQTETDMISLFTRQSHVFPSAGAL